MKTINIINKTKMNPREKLKIVLCENNIHRYLTKHA